MSMEALASRREYSVVNSLYSDASAVGGAPPCDEAKTNLSPSTRATSASVCRWAICDRTTASSLSGSPSRRAVRHVLGQQLEPLGDGRVGEQGEALEVEGLGDVLESLVDLADHVVVGDPDVVEVDLVGALVAHGPDGLDGDAGVVHGHEEERDAVVLGRLGIGAGPHPVPVGEVGRGGPGLLPVEQPPVAVAGGLAAASRPRPSRRWARSSRRRTRPRCAGSWAGTPALSFSLPWLMMVLPMMPTPLPICGPPRAARASLSRYS